MAKKEVQKEKEKKGESMTWTEQDMCKFECKKEKDRDGVKSENLIIKHPCA